MKDFFRHNGILILIAAILLALVTAVVSMLFGGVADPLSNLVGILTTPVRNGITAVTNWAEEKYNDAFELEQMKEELAGLKQRNAELEAQARRAALPAVEVEPFAQEQVDFDTFCKSDFRAVKVKDCQPVKKSNKLLRFTLDDGTGTDRQILSGIAMWYKPEELVGKTLVAIVNLPPRKMMGLESNGMLISAVHTEKGEEQLNLLMIDDKIPAGAKMC